MSGVKWNEEGLSESPLVEGLQHLGYSYVDSGLLDAERGSLTEGVLTLRLARALRKRNPWLSESNLKKAIRALTHPHASSLQEANQALYTALTYGVEVLQDLGSGTKTQQVHFFDFLNPASNEWVVTRQLRVAGSKIAIIPDVVLYVNGIPLVVIECKSPGLGEQWQQQAIDQLTRYQELAEKYRDRGAPKLFQTVQLCIVTCLQDALYGTVGTPARCYLRWNEPWPHSPAAIEAALGRPATPQDVLMYGMLTPENLLDLIHNFVVFESNPQTGKTEKKVPRYQQFSAVNKAVARARGSSQPAERGGVVWHTQGSGKSLTMLWLAMKLRRDPRNDNPTLLIVTDRKDLDEQISRNFKNCGYPDPIHASSVRELRALLKGPTGKTIMTTVQKFQEAGGVMGASGKLLKPKHPELSPAENLFVLTDEAHRTQYGSLAANLRQALPNAVFFGFTGTPIDKKDRSTLHTFGSYIDQYTIEQAVKDGATVPIFYESRLPELRVIGQTLDKVFDHVFADRSPEERAAIKKKYGTEQAIAEAPRRIEALCLDLIDHYRSAIEPGGFKAQLVTGSRRAAVLYKQTLDRLQGPQSTVIFSSGHKDDAELAAHAVTDTERKKLIEHFQKPGDPLKILIVCDMLITGFDAPIEQVMYLDSSLREHTLLQAIARVNRTADKKKYGLVVDYWGVSDNLQEALAIFAPQDVAQAMTPKVDELPRLQARHAAALRFFAGVKDRKDLDRCVMVLLPEDVRAQFEVAFRRFAQSMDLLLPDPRALDYSADLQWLGMIRQAALTRFRDKTIDISDCGDKVRQLIEAAIVADGVSILVKEVNLFSPDFEERLNAHKSPEARASEMEHAIRHEIHTRIEEDPAFYTSLREQLERIVADYRARRIDAAQQLELQGILREQLRKRSQTAQDLGMSETAMALYGLLHGQHAAEGTLDEAKKALSENILAAVGELVRIVDWTQKDDVQRELRSLIKRNLAATGMVDPARGELALKVMQLLKVREGR
jgi:type I restriction enzyme R subunit